MFYALAFDKDRKEMEFINDELSNQIAYHSDEKLESHCVSSNKELMKKLEQIERLDLALVEIITNEGIDVAIDVRKNQDKADMLVISDATISPMSYMIPSIRAAALLLRPYSQENAIKILDDFFSHIFRNRENTAEECFVLENQNGKTIIPYEQIYYFEVSGKKIYVRTLSKEYSRYDTMDNIACMVPDYFERCHRSFIVNMHLVERIKLSENTVFLKNDIMVPLSRSYKNQLKEYMKKNV